LRDGALFAVGAECQRAASVHAKRNRARQGTGTTWLRETPEQRFRKSTELLGRNRLIWSVRFPYRYSERYPSRAPCRIRFGIRHRACSPGFRTEQQTRYSLWRTHFERTDRLVVGEVVKPSGRGRTATWEGMFGIVTRVTEGSVFVQWHGSAVEDEVDCEEVVSTGTFPKSIPHHARVLDGSDEAKLVTFYDNQTNPNNAKHAGHSDILIALC
jgi:hypothetical protein